MKQAYSISIILLCVISAAGAAEKTTIKKTTAESVVTEQVAKPVLHAVENQAVTGQVYRVSPVVAKVGGHQVTVANPPLSVSATRALETQALVGKAALDKKDYALARENFSAGVKTAREYGDVKAETRLLFLEGIANQGEGEASGDALSLKNAVGLYEQVLELKPDSGSAMVNLAQVHSRLHETAAAERLFKQAIQLNDGKRPAYQTAYAGFLEGQGRKEDARRLYTSLLQADPFNQVARKALADYYTETSADWSQLKAYLWGLVKRGEVDQSIELALEALANRIPSRDSDEGLLVIIAASLSRTVGLADGFLASSTAGKLGRLSGRANIGEGIHELFNIYQALAGFDATGGRRARNYYMELSLSWWSVNRGEEGRTPRDVMRQLLNSLGERYGQRQKYAVAEVCFEKAISITPYNPDPTSVRNLVNLYAEQGQEEKINEIASRYEFNLFASKGQAYRDSDLEKIYQYHLTLGQIYSYLAEKSGDWGSSSQSHSALFQLEHAMSVGSMLDEMQGEDPDQHSLHIDPGLVDRLATAYVAIGETERSNSLRLDVAKRYKNAGDERAKDYILGPVNSDALTPRQKREYQLLKSS